MHNSKDTMKIIYSDTIIPDIFVTEFMSCLNDNQIKIYLYCCFLSKNNKVFNEAVLSSVFKLSQKSISEILYTLIEAGLLYKKNTSFYISDLKEVALNKLYKLRTSPSIETLDEKKDIISSLNTKFFQGVMAISWYTSIETLFSLYKFDDDVMYSLFSYCYDRDALSKAYIEAVAKNWSENGVKTNFDLENYFIKYKALKSISNKISKKLNRRTALTQYEEKYIEKWIKEYGFSFDIINLALKATTKISNPNLEYVHKILTTWHKKGYKTKEVIIAANKKFIENKKSPDNSKGIIIKKHYETVRKSNSNLLKERKYKIYQEIQSYKQLEDDITELSIKAFSSNDIKKQNILNSIKEKEDKRISLLIKYGFGKNYLDPIYTCLKCEDTGLLSSGKSCECKKNIKLK